MVGYSKHGVRFAYETPTLKTVSIADIPDSLSLAGADFMQPGAADRLSSVAIVPTANDPSALVMVLVPPEPVWIDQVRGLSKSQFATTVLPQLAGSMEQSMANKVPPHEG